MARKLDDYVVEIMKLERMGELDSVRVFPVLFTWRAQVSIAVGSTFVTVSEWHWRKDQALTRAIDDAVELASQLNESRV